MIGTGDQILKALKCCSFLVCIISYVSTVSAQELFYNTYSGGLQLDVAEDIVGTLDGGYLVTGWSENFNWAKSGLLIKVDSVGDVDWAKSYHGSNDLQLLKIKESPDGNYIVAGLYEEVIEASVYFYIMKITSLGDTLWTKTIGCGKETELTGLEVTSDKIIIGGSTSCYSSSSIAELNSTYLVMTNSLGEPNYGRGILYIDW